MQKRYQVTMSQKDSERLKRMQSQSGALSRSQTIRTALGLYSWFLDRVEEGYEVGATKDDKVLVPVILSSKPSSGSPE